MTQREEGKCYEEARRFAWDYFDLHSKHRLEMFKSYVTFVGLIYAGFGAALQTKLYAICFVLSFLAVALSAIFYLFDVRIRQLIKISENYLLDSEKQLSKIVYNPKIRLFRKSDLITHINRHYLRVTYSNLIGGVYLASVVVAMLSLIVLITYINL